MKITKKLITLVLAAMMLLSLAVPALAADSDFNVETMDLSDDGKGTEEWLLGYSGPGGDVVIPDGVNVIHAGAFSDCTSMTSVTIPSSVNSIWGGAFANCTGLTSVTIYSSELIFGGPVFIGCTSLKSITIPSGVTDIAWYAFTDCTSLTDIYFGGTKEQWESLSMDGSDSKLGDGINPTIHYNSTGPDAPAEQPTQPTTPSFSDVPANAYYAAPVAWAVEKGITNGTSSTTFSPETTCNTAQILTFLWRASGKPEAPESTLTDVKSTDYYYGAAQWAKSKGMISGDALSPETPCTRASTVLFIWQAAGSPAVDTKPSFTDVPAGADYAMAVAWAVENGVTTGTSSTAFSPDQTCTRGQIATFLYRAFAD